jgi:hypothetical protein
MFLTSAFVTSSAVWFCKGAGIKYLLKLSWQVKFYFILFSVIDKCPTVSKCTQWSVWDVTERNENVAEKIPYFLSVFGTYTCRKDTTFVSLHNNTQHGRCTVYTSRTSCATWRAAFPEWYVQRSPWSIEGQLHSVVRVRTQMTWRTPTEKSLVASSPGNSRSIMAAPVIVACVA